MAKLSNIYFDYNATTPLRDGVWQAMSEVAVSPLNASSIHSNGREAKKILNDARNKIAKAFGAEGATIVFTSCGTESNNMALACIKGVQTIVTSEVEHASIARPASYMNNALVGVDGNGLLDLDGLKEVCEKLKDTKFLVSIIHANNETGVIQNINAIKQVVFENGGFLHLDASQSAGKISFDFNNLGCDMATISAHKFGGPKGVAALIIKSGLEILPILHGGGQERFLRAGTENLISIVGMAFAAEQVVERLKAEGERIREIRDFIESGIKKLTPEAHIFGTKAERLPNTISVALKPQTSETQMISFDLSGVAVSAGSACSSGRVVTSHVLVAMGVDQELAKCAIRISIGFNTTLKEAEEFLSIWGRVNNKKDKAA
jgi:cysteine desulfurase